MTPRVWIPLLGFAVMSPFAAAADKDAYGDPLPAGAKLRLGTDRMRGQFSDTVGLLPPAYRYALRTTYGADPRLVDPLTGEVGAKFGTTDTMPASLVLVSADGKRAVSHGYGPVVLWETQTGKILDKREIKALPYEYRFALSADGKVFAHGGVVVEDRDKKDAKPQPPTATVHDVDAKKVIATVKPLQNRTALVALSRDGKTLATWGDHYEETRSKDDAPPTADPARIVQLWSLPDGKELGRAVALGSRPSVQFSPDGKLLAIGTDGYGVALHDAATGKSLRQLAAPYGVTYKLAFSPDGKTLAAADSGGRMVARWDVADGRRLGVTRNPLPFGIGSTGIAFTNNERVLVWGRTYSASYVWEAPSGKVLSPLGGHSGDVSAVGFADGGKTILTGGADARVLRWDAATGKLVGPVTFEKTSGYSSDPSPVGFSRDGSRMFAATNGATVYDLAGEAGHEAFCVPGVGSDFPGTNFIHPSADGSRLVYVSVPYNEKVKTAWVSAWDATTGTKLGAIEIPAPQGECATAITPDGTKVVTVTQPRREKDAKDDPALVVTGWELATGKKLGEYRTTGGYGRRAVIATNDNATGVVLTPDNRVMAIDFVAGQALRQLRPTRPVDRMAFSPDGKYVAVASHSRLGAQAPNFVVVYDWTKGSPVRKYAGHVGSVTALAFSPDSKLLVSGGSDTTALVWDLAVEGEPLDEK